MPLILTLKSPPDLPLEVELLQPTLLSSCSLEQIKTVPVQQGNQQYPAETFFEITGSLSEDQELIFAGDCSCLKNIGQKMEGGTIRVKGNAGLHLGADMKSGKIFVSGNVGDWAGAEMKGGHISVSGNATDFVGATYRGGRRGMTGGEILIHGNAGNEIGRSMRRGLIVIGGDSGSATGYQMLAGSIFLFGQIGKRTGAGMKRGTIVCFAPSSVDSLLPTFLPAALYQPPFMKTYLQHIIQSGFEIPNEQLSATFTRFCGDFTETGRGEIFVCSG